MSAGDTSCDYQQQRFDYQRPLSLQNAMPVETSKTIAKDKEQKIAWLVKSNPIAHSSSSGLEKVCTSAHQLFLPQPKEYACLPTKKHQVGGAFLRNFHNVQKWQLNHKIGQQLHNF